MLESLGPWSVPYKFNRLSALRLSEIVASLRKNVLLDNNPATYDDAIPYNTLIDCGAFYVHLSHTPDAAISQP